MPRLALALVLTAACAPRPVSPLAPPPLARGPTAPPATVAPLAVAPLTVDPLTAAGGVAPWVWFDGASGVCGYLPRFHIEAVDLATGATRWTAPFARVLGQLADGDVVVAGGSTLAVLRRADGTVRYQCTPPAASVGDDADWTQDAMGVHAVPFVREMPSGAARAYQVPPPAPFRVTLTTAGCTAVSVAPDVALRPRLTAPPGRVEAAGHSTRLEHGADGVTTLVGEQDGVERWRRPIPVHQYVPCALP